MFRFTVFLLAAGFLLPAGARAQEMQATEIVRKANDVLNQDAAFAKMKMTIVTTSGETRELFFDSWMKDRGKKSLIRYTAPRRVRDQAMLMLNNADDIWSYFPRTNRVRKLATHAKKQKMQGSDFSYEDMGTGDSFLTDFTHTLLGSEKIDGHDCFTVELKKKENISSNYSRMVVFVEKDRFVIRRIDYFDEKNPAMQTKRLILSGLQVIDGVPTPMKMVMHNLLDDTKTSQEILEVSYTVELDDEMFTERGLKK